MANLDRRLRWTRKKLRAGLCPNCGRRPRHETGNGRLARECLHCLVTDRLNKRNAGGFRAWRPGGPGRPVKYP